MATDRQRVQPSASIEAQSNKHPVDIAASSPRVASIRRPMRLGEGGFGKGEGDGEGQTGDTACCARFSLPSPSSHPFLQRHNNNEEKILDPLHSPSGF